MSPGLSSSGRNLQGSPLLVDLNIQTIYVKERSLALMETSAYPGYLVQGKISRSPTMENLEHYNKQRNSAVHYIIGPGEFGMLHHQV